ncbi:ATP-binding protein [Caulobacter radicis]|nr:ATP-binding protein [Caulobacter radicis]
MDALPTPLHASDGAARLQRLNRRLERLRELAEIQALLAGAEVDGEAFMQIVVDRVQHLLGGHGAVVELVDGEDMVYRAVSAGSEAHLGLRIPRAGSLSGLCVEQARILVCEDSEHDERVDREACRRVGLRSMLCAPLFDGDHAIGVLKAMAGETRAFGYEDVELLRHMSQTLGAAIAKRASFGALRRLLQERTAAFERVERRNHRLALLTEQLREAKAEAEAANRAKSDFLAAMSHELRTPLNGLVGFAELLARDDLAPEQRGAYRDFVHDAARSLLTIVDDILDLSRVEAGKLDLHAGEVDPVRLVESCVAMVRPQAQAKGLAVTTRIVAGAERRIAGDANRLRQVLLNLLNNAVKFTGAGGVTVTLETTGPPGAPALRFSVADTGMGVAAEARERLFQAFGQADASIHPRYGGAGLGLAICKRLVEAMGGTIGFDSVEGEGSTFRFEIPATSADPASSPETIPAETPPLRVLVVDDSRVNRALAEAVLGSAGHLVTGVGDGASGVAAVRDRSFDVVLMDVRMPGMDGLAATRAIRALPPPAGAAPILALTANALPSEIAACLAAGMDGHVAKPIDIAALLVQVKEAATIRRDERWSPTSSARHAAPEPGTDADGPSKAGKLGTD